MAERNCAGDGHFCCFRFAGNGGEKLRGRWANIAVSSAVTLGACVYHLACAIAAGLQQATKVADANGPGIAIARMATRMEGDQNMII